MKNKLKRYKIRINKKTKEKEYKKKFRFVDVNGNVKDTDTKWHLTVEECEDEAKRIIKFHAVGNTSSLRKRTIKEALKEFVKEKKEIADMITKTKNTSAIAYYRDASSLYSNYLPGDIAIIKFQDEAIENYAFNNWMIYINNLACDKHKLSGSSVRRYKRILFKFVEYLKFKNYIKTNTAIIIKGQINDVKLVSKSFGKRRDRNFLRYGQFKEVTNFIKEKNIGSFKNFYWYSLINILFYTGMRVGELVALKFCDIDFNDDNGNGTISIIDLIPEHEKDKNVEMRERANYRQGKNDISDRKITMFASYREILKDYYESYKYHFKLSDKEMMDRYVFPNIGSRKNFLKHQRHKNILRKINKTIEDVNKSKGLDIPKTDAQMFRHATAYFLAYDIALQKEEIYGYFGHIDSTMIDTVYANATKGERMRKANNAMKDLINDSIDDYLKPKSTDIREIVKDSPETRKIKEESRNIREINQILIAISKGQKEYKYLPCYQKLIDRFAINNPIEASKIKFIMETN